MEYKVNALFEMNTTIVKKNQYSRQGYQLVSLWIKLSILSFEIFFCCQDNLVFETLLLCWPKVHQNFWISTPYYGLTSFPQKFCFS